MFKAVVLFLFVIMSINGSLFSCEKPYNPEWDKRIIEILRFNNDSIYITVGTGILIATNDPGHGRVLLSNRHILKDGSNLFVRFNLKDGLSKKVDTVSLEKVFSLGSSLMYLSDTLIDLAVLPMDNIRDSWDIATFTKSDFRDATDLIRGTEIFFLGFPHRILSVSDKARPIYRTGVIALERQINQDFYLIDAIAMPGNSGSAVFNCDGQFIGMLSHFFGHYLEVDEGPEIIIPPIELENDSGHLIIIGSINAMVLQSANINVMIPVSRIIDFMNEIFPGWSHK